MYTGGLSCADDGTLKKLEIGGWANKKLLTHYLVLSPGLLYVDIVLSSAFCFANIFVYYVL